MTDIWLPGWEHIPGNSAGTWASGLRRPKLILHTTEGHTVDAALGAYRAKNAWPHATVDFANGRRVQHVSLDQPARALANKAGGVETNRAPGVIQVEIMGFAGQSHTWPADMLAWLGREAIGPLCRSAGVPLTAGVTFHGEGVGWILATASARQRLSGPAWLDYSGVLGHQHVPENDHWDPGALPIESILAAAGGSPISSSTSGGLIMASLTDAQAKQLVTDAQTAADRAERARGGVQRLEVEMSELRQQVAELTESQRRANGSHRGWLAAIAEKLQVSRDRAVALDNSRPPQ